MAHCCSRSYGANVPFLAPQLVQASVHGVKLLLIPLFERQPVSLERQASHTRTHRQAIHAYGGRGSWRAISAETPSSCADSLRDAPSSCPEPISAKLHSCHARAQLHTGATHTCGTPQMFSTLRPSFNASTPQRTAVKVCLPVRTTVIFVAHRLLEPHLTHQHRHHLPQVRPCRGFPAGVDGELAAQ